MTPFGIPGLGGAALRNTMRMHCERDPAVSPFFRHWRQTHEAYVAHTRHVHVQLGMTLLPGDKTKK
eukprot:8670688-Alexandrium_andersonii.AAC.1